MNLREIPLGNGLAALVDVTDYDDLMRFNWHADTSGHLVYARRGFRLPSGRWSSLRMHRHLLPGAHEVDHINGNGLDNRRSNLRPVERWQNVRNQLRLRSNNTSGYRGVGWAKDKRKWRARIQIQPYRNKTIGYFDTVEDAARAFDKAAIAHYGEFAGRLNFPDEVAA